MAERRVTVGSRVGLHARPAALFVQAATAQPVKVRIANAAGRTVDATSLLGVLSLGVAGGADVVLTADGDGAEATLDALAALLAVDHDAAPSTAEVGTA
ncbi:MAG: phosphocarrier protein HPr [Frankiaceae bacterium]|jgi:phosphocarrier protein|nr:phosphocarrier protein HPr [Frankiaceae bacterium]